MATLEIEGRDVEVDDKFLTLSLEEQNRIVQSIASQIGIKPKANLSNAPKAPQLPGGSLASGALGAADAASFGFADEIGAGINATIDAGLNAITGRQGKTYDEWLAKNRGIQKVAQDQSPGAYLGGQVVASLGTGAGLARGGLSMGANAIRNGATLGRAAMASAADGAILGSISGAGAGEGLADRATSSVYGGLLGGAAGLAAPYAIAGATAAAKPFIAPIASRLNPDAYANSAVGASLRRSGRTVDDIVQELEAARADGQGMYNVADALGNEGQRRLSTIVRTPNDAREMAINALEARQMSQGERLSGFLAEGFDAPDTAAQRASRLTAERSRTANANYDAARQGAGVVDVADAARVADDFLSAGRTLPQQPNGISADSIEGAVSRARDLFTDGRNFRADFNTVLRAKQDISDRISVAQRAGQGNQVRVLSQINAELDSALERASGGYRQANDTFRRQSRVIDAVDAGGGAASSRTRAADNIPAFNAMTPDEQAAFRAGYVDPLISRVEAAAVSPSTNKARMLMTEKTGQEFPAFAAPGRGEQLGNRIGREQRMFETYAAARGGSKTADNLADAAETAAFDPGIVFNAIAGRPVAAAAGAVTTLLRQAQGLPKPVIQRIAEVMLETKPDVARDILRQAGKRQAGNDNVRALGNAILLTMQANATNGGR